MELVDLCNYFLFQTEQMLWWPGKLLTSEEGDWLLVEPVGDDGPQRNYEDECERRELYEPAEGLGCGRVDINSVRLARLLVLLPGREPNYGDGEAEQGGDYQPAGPPEPPQRPRHPHLKQIYRL